MTTYDDLNAIRISSLVNQTLVKSFNCGDSRLDDFLIYESINLDEENCFAAIKIQYFAVDLKFQNDGLGAAMMHRLLSNLLKSDLKFNIGFKLIYLEALSEATDFYQTLGFEYLNPWEETDPTKKSSYMFLPYESLINYYDF